MHIHSQLKPRPEQHIRAVDIPLRDRRLLPLKFKGKPLVQTDAEEDAEAVVGVLDEGFREVVTEGEGRGEDLLEMAGDGLEGGGWGEEGGEEGVFGCCVVDEGEVEVEEGRFEVVGLFVVLCDVGREGCLAGSLEDFYSAPEG